MFKFVTKKEYWDVVDSGILDEIPQRPNYPWHLKSIQDGMAFSYLNKYSNKMIAEIGGGNSRLLPVLARKNTCYNIEEFKGVGGGPKKEIRFEGVTNVSAVVGDFSDAIKDGQFDVIYSISVVEHVPVEKISSFFKDCYRILKPSGLMVHLIDVYLEDAKGDNKHFSNRVIAYASFLDNILFRPIEKPTILRKEDVFFSASYASNPDDMMEKWNRSGPSLKKKREVAQSCTLLMVGRKVGEK